jgi:hypothetical protein
MKLYTAILAASLFMYVGVRNGTGERSSNDSIPVIKVKQYQLFRDWCSSVEYRDDAGNSYIVHCLTRIVYNKHPASSGKKANELKVRLDTGGVVMTVNEPNYPRFPSPSPLPDSTEPKYRYIFKLELGAEMLDRILYVQDSLMTHWGVEKGTTESNNAKLLYFNYSNYIRRSLKLDSVKIEQKGGGK